MLTIVVLYSVDRLRQFTNTISCLEDMVCFSDCEKILCVDGKTNITPDGWKVLEIERVSPFYNLANALNAGVAASSNEKIWYLDSDRVLPKDFISKNITSIVDDLFIFPKYLFSINRELELYELKNLRQKPGDFSDLLVPDHRVLDVNIQSHKNPFAGCVLFTKTTFWKCGGFSPVYEAWGYKDYDFWRSCLKNDCQFSAVDCVELHQKHDFKDRILYVLSNMWNNYCYCKKWDLPMPTFVSPNGKVILHPEQFDNLRDFVNKMKYFLATTL